MTTTDPFTEAARAEAEDYARTPRMNVGTVRDRIAEAHLAGVEWARAHLAAPTTDEDKHQDFLNEVCALLPERYDGDESQESIILDAVRDLAQPTDTDNLRGAVEDRLYDAGLVWSCVDPEGDHVATVDAPLIEVVRAVMDALIDAQETDR
nr:MAG TPA_asm: hypothetical protein [Caudoviricetes sp.]